ncbi:MAG: ATP-dependent DNA helicase [Firmicutes bacterium]|nr:ATP-dependent DNA helicase [Bacillota bacterium]
MQTSERIHVSIRQMVEFICRRGDLKSGGFRSPERALEGTRVHQKLQRSRGSDYQSEVPVSLIVKLEDGLELEVEGRIDGLRRMAPELLLVEGLEIGSDESEVLEIEEIKSTYAAPERLSFDYEPTHRGQLLCYSHILCEQEGLSGALMRLTYFQMESETEHSFHEWWSRDRLASFFDETVREYAKWIRWQLAHNEARTDALERLAFPFADYREGQRTMAAYVYRSIQEETDLFLQAPTGVGKTISALFPALKAMGRGLSSRIFYLTAKTAAARAAQEALLRLQAQDPEILSVALTAKDKICPLPQRSCNPETCPYARGHYDRINDAVWQAITPSRLLGRADILAIAEEHQVCPFELELDISSWCDVIVGDYNYAFDPTASLKRFFQEEKKDYTLLVDEAHNLPDRAQEMFSAVLTREPFVAWQKELRAHKASYRRALRRQLSQIIHWFDMQEEKLSPGEYEVTARPDEDLCMTLDRFQTELADYLMREGTEDTVRTNLYFDILFFLRMQEEFDNSSVVYLQRTAEDVSYHIFCVHPAEKLRYRYERVRSVILFSATLLPIEYYKEMLGGNDPEHPMEAIYLNSPFAPEHKRVFLVRGVRVNYQSRDKTVGQVAAAIYRAVQAHDGNYMVFFPSYPYLQQVAAFFEEAYPEMPVTCQTSGMTEEEKEAWLAGFGKEAPWQLGFAVLGGAFSEGIDLTGTRLIGAVIVTVGLPQLCMERDLIRDYMDRIRGRGFDYAYRFPGLNKVFQAAGRVIRTEEDRGIIVLIDERYREPVYRNLFPPEWQPRVVDPTELGERAAEFWAETYADKSNG